MRFNILFCSAILGISLASCNSKPVDNAQTKSDSTEKYSPIMYAFPDRVIGQEFETCIYEYNPNTQKSTPITPSLIAMDLKTSNNKDMYCLKDTDNCLMGPSSIKSESERISIISSAKYTDFKNTFENLEASANQINNDTYCQTQLNENKTTVEAVME